jgi:energy-coupling factor transporter ATP-binding protein EcfA2
MLINKFYVPQDELTATGLVQIEMNRLGKFVALTGTNGAGKTRVLTKLNECIKNRNQHINNLAGYRDSLKNHRNAIQANPNDTSSMPLWKQEVERCTKILEIAIGRVFSNSEVFINPIHFVPKQLNLIDARQHNKSNLMHHFNAAKNPGINGFEQLCFSYLQQVQNREWAASHQRSTNGDEEKREAKNQYEKLCLLINSLLKTELTRSIDDDAMLFAKPLAEAGLSDGQKVLIQLIVALHAQNTNLKNSIFIMDEPENHLHPSALIEFLDALSQVAENSQFWIATHSVPLLSHIAQTEPTSIWYVENGKVNNAGSNPLKVLRGLLGDDNQIAALNSFTSLPAQFAAMKHATECLFPPIVIGEGKNDPQISQINNVLNPKGNKNITAILDFGAGKSRLLSGLNELAIDQNLDIKESIEYFAYDSYPDDKELSIGN